MDKSRNIYVAGNYIASQTIGTQILHAEHVHNYSPEQPSAPKSTRIAEDVEFEVIKDNNQSPITNHQLAYPFVVPEKLKELNLYTMSEFETMYRNAATAGAPVFAKFLTQYQKLGVLDFGRLNKKQIFDVLKAFFPDEIQYLYNNFITYF